MNNQSEIIEILEDLEYQHDITILYACESGSRVWGFDNEDSDYDIRFIYKFNKLKDYVKLSKVTETINYVEEFDYVDYDVEGWNINKTLNLHYKSNPSLYEWINSPVVYVEDSFDIFGGLPNFDKIKLAHHYKSMCESNFNKYRNDLPYNLDYKKYLYCTRCILAYSSITQNDNYPALHIKELYKDNKQYLAKSVKKSIRSFYKFYKTKNDKYSIGFIELAEMNSWILNSIRIMKYTSLDKNSENDSIIIDGEKFNILKYSSELTNYENYNDKFYELIKE